MTDLGERVAVLEEQQKSEAVQHASLTRIVTEHVKYCSKVQTLGLGMSCIIFGVVAADSPKVAKAFQILASLFLG